MPTQNHTQTPATCANIALHNLFEDKIDLVVKITLKDSIMQLSHSI